MSDSLFASYVFSSGAPDSEYYELKEYVDRSILGITGALAGKNCTIDSITDITGGHRVTFKWTADNGDVCTDYIEVMDGADGEDGTDGTSPTVQVTNITGGHHVSITDVNGPHEFDVLDGKSIQSVTINQNSHLIITYTDGTTVDAGAIQVHSAVTSVNGKTGAVVLDKSDVGLENVENVSVDDMHPTYATAPKVGAGMYEMYLDSKNLALGDSHEKDPDKRTPGIISVLHEAALQSCVHFDKKNNPHKVTKAQVGLDKVGNFKAVSTEASQGLTDTEKANARANIGASDFSGSYDDLSNKPTLGEASTKGVEYGRAGSTHDDSNLTTERFVTEWTEIDRHERGFSQNYDGGVEIANLPEPGLDNQGTFYRIADNGLTDSRFSCGAGKPIRAGDHVVVTRYGLSDYYYDLFSGPVDTSVLGAIPSSEKGANNGIATLGADGKVPSSQLPAFVDDVLEFNSLSDFPATGESGKIYVAKDTNKTYRWSGSDYVEISSSLALGETSSTAYAGDKGKAVTDAVAAIKDGTAIDSFGDVETALADKVSKSNTTGLLKNDGTVDINAYAKQSEMSVTDGTGSDADKTTIQLKNGTSATVLKSHQNISGKNDVITVTDESTAGVFGDTTEFVLNPGSLQNPTSFIKRKASALWTYIKNKITGGASSIVDVNLEASRTLVSDANGKVAASQTTATELGYVHNVTSAIQSQLDSKVPAARTVNGHALSANISVTKSDLGLENVGNYKAVSTVANQSLTDTEKSNARANIGAGTSSFSGSYIDLSDKPTLGSAAAKNVASSGNAGTTEVVMGNDTRLTDARTPTPHTHTTSEITDFPSLATVATSGSYDDLSDKPTIPSAVTVDSAMSSTSENPVQNKVIKSYVDNAITDEVSARNTAITNAINNLDVSSVGGTGKYISEISEANGKISATETTMDTTPTANSTKVVTSGGVKAALDGKVPTSRTINGKALSANITLSASDVSAIPSSEKGANNGVAELDETGKVPSSQLPSYVDDVLEYNSLNNFPATGESGKIYIAKDTNKTYRWSGTTYVQISASLSLGETSSTAYRGDRGKEAYEHSQVTSGNPHNVTKSDVGLGNVVNTGDSATPISGGTTKFTTGGAYTELAKKVDKTRTVNGHALSSDVTVSKSDVGLGNVGNFKAVSTVANQGLTATEKSNARTNIGAGTSSFSGSYNDLTNRPSTVMYCTCATVAGTALKELVKVNNCELVVGTIVAVKFSATNTASSVQFTFDGGTTKYSIYYNNAVYTGASSNITGYANRTIYYMFNGTHFVYQSDGLGQDGNNNVTQTASTGNADYEVLFSVTADNTTRTEGARKNSNFKFNPSTGNLTVTTVNGFAFSIV